MRDSFDDDFARYIEGEEGAVAPSLSLKVKSVPIKRRKPKTATDLSLYRDMGIATAKAIADAVAPLEARIAQLEAAPTKFVGGWSYGTEYAARSIVAHGGSMWHCNEPTTDKPGTSDAWTLCCKKGRDGKDAGR